MAESTSIENISNNDELLKVAMDKIIDVLQLDDIEKKDDILKDLFENGRQSLIKYEEYLIPEIYTAVLADNDNDLMKILNNYTEQRWKVQYGSGNEWFVLFLVQYQDDGNCGSYKRVLHRSAEYGNKYMQNCPILSVVLQILFDGIDDSCLVESNVFNDLWATITNDGLKSIKKYYEYIAEDVMKELINKKQVVLFHALREYYRPVLFKLFEETKIMDRQNLYELALHHVAELGWLEGLQSVKMKIALVKLKEVLAKLPCRNKEQPNKEFRWYWQSNSNPWSTEEEAEFTPYLAVNNHQIETAFLNNESEVVFNEVYKIDFKNRVQINLKHAQRRRSVIRQELVLPNRTTATTINNNIRYEFSSDAVRTSTTDTRFRGCSFILNWYISITNGLLEKPESEIVELAIQGIKAEAELYQEREKAMELAEYFVDKLRKVQNKTKKEIQEVCIQLYTQESFLYRIINVALRDNDQSKSITLGPICHLLYDYVGRPPQNAQGTLTSDNILYRGERLTPDVIEEYKRSIGTNHIWKWTQFISTSKSRSMAEKFRDANCLYEIKMDENGACQQGVCISSISRYTIEDEVLLPPGIRFKITEMKEEEDTKRHVISITIMSLHMSTLC
jgi:hypothetical protein